MQSFGLRVPGVKNKVQVFGHILDAITESISVSAENVEVTETLTYHCTMIHSSNICEEEVNRRPIRA